MMMMMMVVSVSVCNYYDWRWLLLRRLYYNWRLWLLLLLLSHTPGVWCYRGWATMQVPLRSATHGG
jgi:hypothetical protein